MIAVPGSISRLEMFKIIFSHPVYIISTIVSAAVFYAIFYYLIAISNKGIFLLLLPGYLVYTLMITSGILFSISLYIIIRSILTKAARLEGSVAGVLLPSLGGLIASCGCSFSVLASIMIFFGINTFNAVGFVSAVSNYQIPLFAVLISANLIIIYYYLGKIANFHRKR